MRRLFRFVAAASVVFVLHVSATVYVSLWAAERVPSRTATVVWDIIRFPEDLPTLVPSEYGTLLNQFGWPEGDAGAAVINSGIWAVVISLLVCGLWSRLDQSSSGVPK